MSEKKELNRRQFLERAALIGAAAFGAGAFLSACDPPEVDNGDDDEPDDSADDFSCDDEEALADFSAEELEGRENHQYTDTSPESGQYCDNCAFWEDPEAGADCGGCALPQIAGPVHPKGWCDLWAPAS